MTRYSRTSVSVPRSIPKFQQHGEEDHGSGAGPLFRCFVSGLAGGLLGIWGRDGAGLTLFAKVGAKVLLRVSSVHTSCVPRGHDWFSCFTCKISDGYERYSISIFCRELLKMLDNALKYWPPPFAVQMLT